MVGLSIGDLTQPDRMMEIIEEIKACGNGYIYNGKYVPGNTDQKVSF